MPEAAEASLAMPTVEAVPASPAWPSRFECVNVAGGASILILTADRGA
jgi:hypothetical protein